MPRTRTDCLISAFAGAAATSLMWGWSSSNFPTVFLTLLLTTVGFLVLWSVGPCLTRRLATTGRLTLLNGALLGAAAGSLTASALATLVTTVAVGFSPFAAGVMAAMVSIFIGVLNGAVTGVVFAWLSRKRFSQAPVQVPVQTTQIAPPALKWEWLIIVPGLAIPAAGLIAFQMQPAPQRKNFAIAGEVYDWPLDTTVFPPGPRKASSGFVQYRSSRQHLDRDAFLLTYEGEEQDSAGKAGPVRAIGTREERDTLFLQTRAGDVSCDVLEVKVGLAQPCDLDFIHRGARWTLKFGAHRIDDASELKSAAIERLETFRRAPPAPSKTAPGPTARRPLP